MNTQRFSSHVAALLLAVGVAMSALAVIPAVADDKRDEAVAAQKKAEEQIESLRSELEGIDADLAKLFVEMETVNQQLPVVEAELAAAEEELEAAERKHQQIEDQLTAANAESERLGAELEAAAEEEISVTQAVAEMAREYYRGGVPSPLGLMMTADSSADISERASVASTMARAQSSALESVRESIVVGRNQAEKQAATTERITELEAAAAVALAEAAAAEQEISAKRDQLTALKEQQIATKAAWDSQKSAAEASLAKSEKAQQAAADKVAKIDEENRKAQLEFVPLSPSQSDSGAMFQSPLAGPLYISSPFGWRIHPIFGTSRLHSGTDFAAGCGVPQFPIRDGVVASVEYDSGGGNMVYVNHGMIDGSSWTSIHMHLQSAAVSIGQRVDRSTVIGYTGTTGNSTGCHLHLSLLQNGQYTDPMNFL